MDDIDTLILSIISDNGGQATTRDIIDGLHENKYRRSKVAVIQRLRALDKFGYVVTSEGISHRGRKPLIFTIVGD